MFVIIEISFALTLLIVSLSYRLQQIVNMICSHKIKGIYLNIRIHSDITGEMWLGVRVDSLPASLLVQAFITLLVITDYKSPRTSKNLIAKSSLFYV